MTYLVRTAPQNLNAQTQGRFDIDAGYEPIFIQTIPLETLVPGAYRLEIQVNDNTNGASVTRQVEFTIRGRDPVDTRRGGPVTLPGSGRARLRFPPSSRMLSMRPTYAIAIGATLACALVAGVTAAAAGPQEHDPTRWPLTPPAHHVTDIKVSEDVQAVVQERLAATLVRGVRAFDWERAA